jgi:hypothetical protein
MELLNKLKVSLQTFFPKITQFLRHISQLSSNYHTEMISHVQVQGSTICEGRFLILTEWSANLPALQMLCVRPTTGTPIELRSHNLLQRTERA